MGLPSLMSIIAEGPDPAWKAITPDTSKLGSVQCCTRHVGRQTDSGKSAPVWLHDFVTWWCMLANALHACAGAVARANRQRRLFDCVQSKRLLVEEDYLGR